MARPDKENVDFFSHDTVGGKTLFVLEDRFGNDGYAFWFKLLELLGREKGLFYDCNGDEAWIYMVSRARVNEAKATEILSVLSRMDAIDKELWEHKIIWSQNFVDRLDSLYSRRKTPKPQKPNVALPNIPVIAPETPVIAAETPLNPVNVCNNDQSRVEESRVKEKGQGLLLKSGDLSDGHDENSENQSGERLTVQTARGSGEIPVDQAMTRFEEFWKAYPRKVGKKAAFGSWKRIRPSPELIAKILSAIETAKRSEQWQRENGKFIPHPTTWLNQGRWDDEPPEPPESVKYEWNPVKGLYAINGHDPPPKRDEYWDPRR